MKYMLDTNIVSVLLRDQHGPPAQRLRTIDQPAVGTSIVVAAELRFGVAKIGASKVGRMVEAFLATFRVEPWDVPCDHTYARLRADLERRGTPIGPMDMMIAAHALALDAVLVTDNDREFRRVADLKIENWVR